MNVKQFLVLGGLFLFALSACRPSASNQQSSSASSPTQSQPQTVTTYTFEGKVEVPESSSAEGALVALTGTPYYDTANSAGDFSLENIPSGDYQMEVYHNGYANSGPVAVTIGGRDQTLAEPVVLEPKGNNQRLSNLVIQETPNSIQGRLEIREGDMVPYDTGDYISMRQSTTSTDVKFKVVYEPGAAVTQTSISFNGKQVDATTDMSGSSGNEVQFTDAGGKVGASYSKMELGHFMALEKAVSALKLDKLGALDQNDPKTAMLASLAGVATSMTELPAGKAMSSYKPGKKSNRYWGDQGFQTICGARGSMRVAYYFAQGRGVATTRLVEGETPNTPECRGRCGRRCGGLPGATYLWTQDCFEHDICVQDLNDAQCFPDFIWAIDDQIQSFFYGCDGRGPCPVIHALSLTAKTEQQVGESNSMMYEVRYFLSKTEKGQSYVDLFYRHSSALSGVFASNPELALELGKFLFSSSKDINLVLAGKGDRVVLKEAQLKEALGLMRNIATTGGGTLQTDLQSVEQELFSKLKAGRSARSALEGLGLF